MKIDRLETHDRYEHFVKGEFDISRTIQSIIDKRPFGDVPFYVFAHKREMGLDERYAYWMQTGCTCALSEVPTARLIWQPRLTKPEAQENSMLFRVSPGTDLVKVIWMIPQRELWEQYEKGKMLENTIVGESIETFKTNPRLLEFPDPEDLPEKHIRRIYEELSRTNLRQVV